MSFQRPLQGNLIFEKKRPAFGEKLSAAIAPFSKGLLGSPIQYPSIFPPVGQLSMPEANVHLPHVSLRKYPLSPYQRMDFQNHTYPAVQEFSSGYAAYAPFSHQGFHPASFSSRFQNEHHRAARKALQQMTQEVPRKLSILIPAMLQAHHQENLIPHPEKTHLSEPALPEEWTNQINNPHAGEISHSGQQENNRQENLFNPAIRMFKPEPERFKPNTASIKISNNSAVHPQPLEQPVYPDGLSHYPTIRNTGHPYLPPALTHDLLQLPQDFINSLLKIVQKNHLPYLDSMDQLRQAEFLLLLILLGAVGGGFIGSSVLTIAALAEAAEVGVISVQSARILGALIGAYYGALIEQYVMSKGDGQNNNFKPSQQHHIATDKHKTYTRKFQEIADKYGLNLDEDWNKVIMPHQGRHPEMYHEYVLNRMEQIDTVANGNKKKFLELFNEFKQKIKSNPDMLTKKYWMNKQGIK